MNEQTLLKKLGFSAHSPIGESIQGDDYNLDATCKKCGLDITSYYNDDPDRLSGWTAWRALSGSCQVSD